MLEKATESKGTQVEWNYIHGSKPNSQMVAPEWVHPDEPYFNICPIAAFGIGLCVQRVIKFISAYRLHILFLWLMVILVD